MKSISFTEFRKGASAILDEVELGATIVLLRHGKPVAQLAPYSAEPRPIPSWRQPIVPLQIPGSDISSAILEERESGR